MINGTPRYNNQWSILWTPESGVWNWDVPTFRDMVGFAEGAPVGDDICGMLQARGIPAAHIILGMHTPVVSHYFRHPWMIPMCYDFTFTLPFACSLHGLEMPVNDFWYEQNKLWEEEKERIGGLEKLMPETKQNVVLIDNDSGIDLSRLKEQTGWDFRVLSGYTRDGMLQNFRQAKVEIDLGLPGTEWANIESSLFDVCHVVSSYRWGRNTTGAFPWADDRKVPVVDLLANAERLIVDMVTKWPACVEEQIAFKQRNLMVHANWLKTAEKAWVDDVNFVILAITPQQINMVFPLLVSIYLRYPMATVEIWRAHTDIWVWDFAAELRAMMHQTPVLGRVVGVDIGVDHIQDALPVLYTKAPQFRRRFTVLMTSDALTIGPDLVLKNKRLLEARVQSGEISKAPFVSATVSEGELYSVYHFVHTASYYKSESSALPMNEGESQGRYLYRLMEHKFFGAGSGIPSKYLFRPDELSNAVVPYANIATCSGFTEALLEQFYEIRNHHLWFREIPYTTEEIRCAMDVCFPDSQYFHRLCNKGGVVTPIVITKEIVTIVDKPESGSGEESSVFDYLQFGPYVVALYVITIVAVVILVRLIYRRRMRPV